MNRFRKKRRDDGFDEPLDTVRSDPFSANRVDQDEGPDVGDGLESLLNGAPDRPLAPIRKPKKRPSGGIVLSRRALFLGTVALGILMIWVFTLGIMVGRGLIFQSQAFKQLQERLAGTESGPGNPMVEDGEPPTVVETPPEPPEPELTFYNSLTTEAPGSPSPPANKTSGKLTKPPEPEKKSLPAAPKETPEPGTSVEKPVIAPPPKVQPAPEVETQPAPVVSVETPAPGRVAVASGVRTVPVDNSQAPPPARKGGENFTIQVAAASTADRAERMVKSFRANGHDAYYYQVELEGRQYFRVRIGHFENRETAEAELKRLKDMGFKNMFISALTD